MGKERLCEDCGREMVRFGDYTPPVWKCYYCNIEVEEDIEVEDTSNDFDGVDVENL